MTFIDDLGIKLSQKLLRRDKFTIISNDCWGAEVYRHFGLAYQTPFVGLFFMAPCYIKLLKDLKSFLHTQDLVFISTSKYEACNQDRAQKGKYYPIGVLNGEVEIHFLHYHSEEEARETWTKRCTRVNWERLFVKLDAGKDACTPELVREYDALPYTQKIILSPTPLTISLTNTSVFVMSDWIIDGAKMYRRCLAQLDICNWLSNGSTQKRWWWGTFYTLFIKKSKRFL